MLPWSSFSCARILPGLSTVLLGLVGLFATETRANTSAVGPGATSLREPGVRRPNMGQVVIRTDGENICFSDDGATFEAIDETTDGVRLRELLKRLNIGSEAVVVPVNRVIVADGGAGAHRPKQAEPSKESAEKSTEGK